MKTNKLSRWAKLVLVSVALQCGYAFAGDAAITAVEVLPSDSGKQVVKISLSEAATVPASFAVNTPPRIALDFVNTTNGLGKSSIPVSGDLIKQINIAENTGRTRLVLSLLQNATYETRVDGKQLILSLTTSKQSSVSNATTQFSAPAAGTGNDSIKNVDFRRGKNGEGMIVVDMSNPNIGIDIKQQGKNLAVEFDKTGLPKNLERRMDVVDFATPVQKIDTYSQGQSVKMLIEPKGSWEYSAYQTENRFIIEVKTASDGQANGQGRVVYKGDKLSLNFQNVEIRTVLQVIAEFTGKNIIASDEVNGNLTLRLKDVPWDQALDLILQTRNLDKRESGNVMWIAPRDRIQKQEEDRTKAQKAIAEAEPMRTETFELKYHKAASFKKFFDEDKAKLLSPNGYVITDERTNKMIVHDVPTKLEVIRDLVAKTDVPVRQVMIEARIVEATDGFSRSLGARIGFGAKGSIGNTNATMGSNLSFVDSANQTAGNISSVANSTVVNLPTSATGGGTAGSFAVLFSNSAGNLLGLEISAQEADSKVKIVSSPRLITADQVEATIEDGTEIPYEQATSSGATSISFKKATLSLKVKPQITPDGNIIMDLKINKDSRGKDTSAGPAIDTKQIDTQVLVENGGTVVIGGIYSQEKSDTVQKVPFLGDIPLLGALFRSTTNVDNRRELLIFITPRVLKDELSLR